MNCLILKIITLIITKYVVLFNNDLTEASIVFSVTSNGRLPGELLLAVSKRIIGDMFIYMYSALHMFNNQLPCTFWKMRTTGRYNT